MNGRKAHLSGLVSPAILATALAAVGPLDAREVCDDFAADPDWQDGDPVCWRHDAPCCPGQVTPGACEGIEGLALLQGIPQNVTGLGTCDSFAGDVAVRTRFSFCGTTGGWDVYLHFDAFQVSGYLAGIGIYQGQWWVGITKWQSGIGETQVIPVDLDPTSGVFEMELASVGDRLELRVWPDGAERPAVPGFTLLDTQFRTGEAGFAYLRSTGGERGVISSICITELEEPPPPPPRFRRGDANADGRLDISDGVSVLGYLFLGDEAPDCLDAGDVNDSGGLEISDALFLLNHLFLGGIAPPPPGASECGPDPTGDELGCEAFAPCASGP